ncbi:MAG: hypothetical protein ACRDHD_03000 [Candidatus Limnocylindria bacterium]
MAEVEPKNRTEQLANPFRPGNGVRPPYLAGRDRLLVEFDAFLAESHPPHLNWTLTGIRGTGKTVLLGEFAGRGERAGWLCTEREVGERHRDEQELADALADDCQALIRRCSALAGVGDAIERAWAYVRPRRISVGEVGYEPAYGEESPDAARQIRAAIEGLDGALAETEAAGALLLFDEAHLLTDDRRAGHFPLSSLLAGLGHAQRTSSRVRVVLCGLPTLSLNLKRARTYAERMFRHVVIGNLDLEDAWDALRIPLSRSDRSFELALLGEIVERTAGYAYFLQFFAGYLCSRIGHPEVRLADYLKLEPSLLHELDLAFFEDRYLVAGTAGQRMLSAMARSGGRVSAMSLRRALGDLPNVDVIVRRLIDRGLVYRPTRGTYDFALPLFGSYLRRRAELTHLTPTR